MQRLMSNAILHSLNLSEFEICTKWIKEKQKNVRKSCAERCSDQLQLIHIDGMPNLLRMLD